MADENTWVKVVFLSDCDCDEDMDECICPECGEEYGDCLCPGPMQDDIFDYKFDENDVMWARKKKGVEDDA